MAVLAGNASLISTLLGVFIALIGIYDVAGFRSVALCQFLQYSGFGVGIAFKAAQLCVAVDQFVAVRHPLHHYSIMMRARPWLIASAWLTYAVQIIIGITAYFLDMETFSEYVARQGNNSTFTGCRWETGLANVYTFFVETVVVVFSSTTACLLIYTGFIGLLFSRKLRRNRRGTHQNGMDDGINNDNSFLDNYRAFKRIMAVLSLTVTLDIVAPSLRISSRWYPQPTLNGLLHQARLFGFIFEGWAYGLQNKKLRAAYRNMLCGGRNQVVASELRTAPEGRLQNQRPTAPGSELEEIQQQPPPTASRSRLDEGHESQVAASELKLGERQEMPISEVSELAEGALKNRPRELNDLRQFCA